MPTLPILADVNFSTGGNLPDVASCPRSWHGLVPPIAFKRIRGTNCRACASGSLAFGTPPDRQPDLACDVAEGGSSSIGLADAPLEHQGRSRAIIEYLLELGYVATAVRNLDAVTIQPNRTPALQECSSPVLTKVNAGSSLYPIVFGPRKRGQASHFPRLRMGCSPTHCK